ncbi:hypothetical protein BDN70DRAFT_874059 [Pholiota conissans]|uniref:Uncharacterized protein n=1 Tax=Pholiota conissans TaxID=109636 RepID=A0A9P6CXP8_9AGAR|nr:hypothetical protein BDN70DRAFT_874059 [Pholiota conissans]
MQRVRKWIHKGSVAIIGRNRIKRSEDSSISLVYDILPVEFTFGTVLISSIYCKR